MSLQYMDGDKKINKVDDAVKKLKLLEPKEGYYLAFSGGKDSQCIYHLAKLAGVKFEAHCSLTTIDPPQLLRFIKKNYPDVVFDVNHDSKGNVRTMWTLLAEKTSPPTRRMRYCCADLKECNGKGRVTVTGVRWQESSRRKRLHGFVDVETHSKKIIDNALNNVDGAAVNDRGTLIMSGDNDQTRQLVEQCYRNRKTVVNPILDWSDEDVWQFLNDYVKVQHCQLYDAPWNLKRIGCIGCPMAHQRMQKQFEMWPHYRKLYTKAFDNMVKLHEGMTLRCGDYQLKPSCGDDVFTWWLWTMCYDMKEQKTPEWIKEQMLKEMGV